VVEPPVRRVSLFALLAALEKSTTVKYKTHPFIVRSTIALSLTP
jgi:hypothetical protein